MRSVRILLASGLLVAAPSAAITAGAAADGAPWLTPFHPDAAELYEAAEAEVSRLDVGDHGFGLVLDELSVIFGDGEVVCSERVIYLVTSPAAVQATSQVSAAWAPWLSDPPEVRARVIAADGRVSSLDPATILEVPFGQDQAQVLSDRRELRAPLLRLGAGSLVETQVVHRVRLPRYLEGWSERHLLAADAPVARSRVILDAPSGLGLRYELQLLPDARVERTERDGRTRVTVAAGPLEPLEPYDAHLPGDVPYGPAVTYSTAPDWESVAAAYAAVVEEGLAGASLAERAGELAGGLDGRDAKVAALTQWLHDTVRYTGLQLDEAALLPRSPVEVTLAAIYAELDRPLEGKEVLLQAIGARRGTEPEPHDWYVLGRIAETYGLSEVAAESYARVERPERPADDSVWALAQRRASALARPSATSDEGVGPGGGAPPEGTPPPRR